MFAIISLVFACWCWVCPPKQPEVPICVEGQVLVDNECVEVPVEPAPIPEPPVVEPTPVPVAPVTPPVEPGFKGK